MIKNFQDLKAWQAAKSAPRVLKIRRSLYMKPDIQKAGEERAKTLKFKSFSAYVSSLIEKDCTPSNP